IIIAWEDERNSGTSGADIYAKILDSNGNTIKDEFPITIASNTQASPSITTDQNNHIIIAWHDYRNGNYDIYAEILDSNGNTVKDEFPITAHPNTQASTSITTDQNNNIIIAWHDWRNSGTPGADIYAEILDSNGNTIKDEFPITTYSNDQYRPSITTDQNSNIIIAWYDYRSGTDYDIYYKILNSTFKPGSVFEYDDETVSSSGSVNTSDADQSWSGINPADRFGYSLAMADFDNDGGSDIIAGAIGSDEYGYESGAAYLLKGENHKPAFNSTLIGAHINPFPFIDGLVSYWQFEYDNGTVTPDATGRNNGTLHGDVKLVHEGRVGKAYEFDGDGDYITVDSVTADLENENISIAFWLKSGDTSDQSFFVSFHNNIGSNKLLIGRQTGSNKLSIYNGTHWAGTSSAEVIDDNWHFVTIIFDTVADNVSIYIDGNYDFSVGCMNDILSTDKFTIGMEWDGSNPSDFFNGTLDEIIVFDRLLSLNEIKELYNLTKGKYAYADNDLGCSPYGIVDPDGDNVDVIYNWYVNNQSILVLNMPFEKGSLVFEGESADGVNVVKKAVSGASNGYVGYVNESGEVIITNASNNQEYPSITTDQNNHIIIAWEDYRNGNYDIYAEILDSNGNTIKDEFPITNASSHQLNPTITTDQNNHIIIAWRDYRNGNYDIYAEILDSNGNTIKDEFPITTDSNIQASPSITTDQNNHIIIA
ncbi:hypothetical protein DRJ16_07295, partial [Candidatus Woesearchaeota archaeon]